MQSMIMGILFDFRAGIIKEIKKIDGYILNIPKLVRIV